MPLKEDKLDQHSNHRCQEHKNRNAVDAMHVFHPLGIGRVGVFFFEIKILGDLSESTHKKVCLVENWFRIEQQNRRFVEASILIWFTSDRLLYLQLNLAFKGN